MTQKLFNDPKRLNKTLLFQRKIVPGHITTKKSFSKAQNLIKKIIETQMNDKNYLRAPKNRGKIFWAQTLEKTFSRAKMSQENLYNWIVYSLKIFLLAGRGGSRL